MILPLKAPKGELSVNSLMIEKTYLKYTKEVQEYSNHLRMHMRGIGLKKAIEKFDYYESPRQLRLRQKYSPSNEDFFARIHRPYDKIFTAKGGSTNFIMPDSTKKKYIEKITNIKDGLSVRKWVETYWADTNFYDPMGMVFMEVGNNETYPTYITVDTVYQMPRPKGKKFEWLILKEDKRKYFNEGTTGMQLEQWLSADVGQYYRVIDDASDRVIKWDGTNATVIDEYPNYYGFVPAYPMGYKWDTIHERYASPDDPIIPIADQYLRNRSVLVMFELHHGFPMTWMYESNCPTCNGNTKVKGDPCPSCNGTGKDSKREVSKMMLIPFPTSKDMPVIDKPGGIVEAAVDSWQEMKLTISEQYKEAHYATWGTHQIEDSSANATATGRFIDVQPVNDKLTIHSEAAETLLMWIYDRVGQFYFESSYEKSEVNLGRRYLIETPDAISDKLQKAIGKKMSYSYLKNMYFQWVDSEYSGDEMMRRKLTMEFKLDPAPFMTVQEAKQAFTNPLDYYKKMYYGQWLETLKENWYIASDFDTLLKQFNEWTLTQLKAEQTILQQFPQQQEQQNQNQA
jgi:hypothetical protein